MSTLSTRLQLLLADDGGAGGDDTVDVTTQIVDNLLKLEDAVGLFNCMAATRPLTNNYIGRLIRETDTGTVLEYDGAAWVVLFDTKWITFTPVISSTLGPITLGASTVTGKYARFGSWAYARYDFVSGVGFGGGTGPWLFSYPPGCPFQEQEINGTAYIALSGYAEWGGIVITSAAGITVKAPIAATNSNYSTIQNASHPAGPAGTGFPQRPGAFTFDTAGSEIRFSTRYRYK